MRFPPSTYTLSCTGAGVRDAVGHGECLAASHGHLERVTFYSSFRQHGHIDVVVHQYHGLHGQWRMVRRARVSGTAVSGALTANTAFVLTCTGAGGSATQTANVTVTTPVPTLTLTASPTAVTAGSTSTLNWSSANATGCSASGGWSGAQPVNGSFTTGALSVATTFTLTCTGAGGSVNQSVTVGIASAANVDQRGWLCHWKLCGGQNFAGAVHMRGLDRRGVCH